VHDALGIGRETQDWTAKEALDSIVKVGTMADVPVRGFFPTNNASSMLTPQAASYGTYSGSLRYDVVSNVALKLQLSRGHCRRRHCVLRHPMTKNSLTVILCLTTVLALTATTHADEIVVVMGAGAAALTMDQVARIYLGRNNNLTPIDLPESNPLRAAFYKKATDRDPPQIKAQWSRLTFTGQGRPPKELPDAAAIKKAVAADRKAVGYIDKADVDASVKVVLTLN